MTKLNVEVSLEGRNEIVLTPKNKEANDALLGLAGGDFAPIIDASHGLKCRKCKKIIPNGDLNDYGRSIACKCKEPEIMIIITPGVF